MNIGLLGTSYKYTQLINIEKIIFNKEESKLFFETLKKSDTILECTILSTCNRIEFYFTSEGDIDVAKQWLIKKISEFKKLSQEEIEQLLFFTKGDSVIEHLFRVTSGVESMVFGENEILGQVKE